MNTNELQNLQVTGDISVQPVPPNSSLPTPSYRYLIMGPTGAGKSTFIEAFAGKSQKLSISRDQLAGFTQCVTPYQLINVERHSAPIYLLDTPGFSDTRISELEIVNMVLKWFADNDHGLESFIDRILFLTPITDTRLAGSKRRTIKMVNELLKLSRNESGVIFVTTMWDTLHTEQTRKRAESNFAELRDAAFKDLIEKGSEISQFWNTSSSALKILDTTVKHITTFNGKRSIRLPNLYHDLYERIEGSLQRKILIESELDNPEVETNPMLKSILQQIHRENEEILTKFTGQFNQIDSPPAGLGELHDRLRNALAPIPNRDVSDITTTSRDQNPRSPDANMTSPPLSDMSPKALVPVSSGAVFPPTGIAEGTATRTLMLKGLLRRLVHAAKRRGNKLVGKSKEQ